MRRHKPELNCHAGYGGERAGMLKTPGRSRTSRSCSRRYACHQVEEIDGSLAKSAEWVGLVKARAT